MIRLLYQKVAVFVKGKINCFGNAYANRTMHLLTTLAHAPVQCIDGQLASFGVGISFCFS